MQHLDTVNAIVTDTLGLRGAALKAASPLMGALPELDSMAVLALIAALETHFGFAIDDDEIKARHFATLGSLTSFVQEKLAV